MDTEQHKPSQADPTVGPHVALKSKSQAPDTITIKRPPFAYFHLTLLSPHINPQPLDILAARTYLTSALQQFLGVTGTAIPIDFLKVDGRDAWVRVPREDRPMVTGALSGWIGGDGVAWRIMGSADWLGALVAGTGQELFKR